MMLALIVAIRAQSDVGRIQGIVRDASGSILPGVEIKLMLGTNLVQRSISDADGRFEFVGLAPGSYTVTAALAGFRTTTLTTVVDPRSTRELAIVLIVGATTETVTVTGSAPVVDANNAKAVTGGVFAGVRGGMEAAPPPPQAPAAEPAFRGSGTGAPRAGGAPTRFNTEAYDKIDDNQWTSPANKPLSTFSIDVDTASYSNVRRFLHRGQLPPKDAVRLEELLNYFTFDYPQPRDGSPFSVTTALAEAPWNPRHRLALIGLQGKRIDSSRTPPRNLVFLVDVSGSMQTPVKLPLVKSSLAMLARNLTSRDRIAVVVYAGAAGLVLPSTRGDDTPTIFEALGRLQAGGSTNGAQGLRLAYQTARDHFIPGGINRVILATDGDFNVGVTNQGDLIRLIEEARDGGVALTVLGYGMGNLKDSTMEKLADKGNGNYAYIDSLSEAQKVLVEQAGGTLVTIAKDVKLQIEFNPKHVVAYRLIGYENRVLQDRDFNDDRKDAGELGAGHSVTALYEIVPAGVKIDMPGVDPLRYQTTSAAQSEIHADELMAVKLRYKQPDAEVSQLRTFTVRARRDMAPELGFAAAVAEFGMLLRDSEFKGTSSYAQARNLATRFKGGDSHGHRAEFIRLIGLAESLSPLQESTR
jgi:Ca-activated chloride channel family protein